MLPLSFESKIPAEQEQEDEEQDEELDESDGSRNRSRRSSSSNLSERKGKRRWKEREADLGERRKRRESGEREGDDEWGSDGERDGAGQRVPYRPSNSRRRSSNSGSRTLRRQSDSYSATAAQRGSGSISSEEENVPAVPSSSRGPKSRTSFPREKSRENTVHSKDFANESKEQKAEALEMQELSKQPRSFHNPFSFKSHPIKSKRKSLERTASVSFNDTVKVGGGSSSSGGTSRDLETSKRMYRSDTLSTEASDSEFSINSENGFTDDDTDVDTLTIASSDEEEDKGSRWPKLPFLALWRKLSPPSQPDGEAPAALNLHRRTPIISGVFAPFAIMLEVSMETTERRSDIC